VAPFCCFSHIFANIAALQQAHDGLVQMRVVLTANANDMRRVDVIKTTQNGFQTQRFKRISASLKGPAP